MTKQEYENWWPIYWRKMVSMSPKDKVKCFGKERPVHQVRTIVDWGLSSFVAFLVVMPFLFLYCPNTVTLVIGLLAIFYFAVSVYAIVVMRKRFPVPVKRDANNETESTRKS